MGTPSKRSKPLLDDGEPTTSDDADATDAAAAAESQMKLDEINDDCFQEIIKYLDFMDLLNLAATNQRINQVASTVFARKFSSEAVCISPNGVYITSPDLTEQPDIMLASDETDKFVRHLGPLVGRLTVNSLEGDDGVRLARLIFEQCADSLTEIVLRGLAANITSLIQRPFPRVESVYLNRCQLGRQILQFNRWFPEMERLMIYNCSVARVEYLEHHFAKLTHLTWEYASTDNGRANDAFRALTKCNPQIESVRIDCAWDAAFLRNLDRHLKRLKRLELTLDYQTVATKRKVYFHNVNKLVVHLRDTNAMAGHLPFTFKRLAEIHLHLDCHDTATPEMVDFVVQHRGLLKLNIFFPVDRAGLHRLAHSLPALEMFGLSGIGFSAGDAAQALNEFPKLRKFRIFNEHRFEDLLSMLGAQWHACADRKFFLKQVAGQQTQPKY